MGAETTDVHDESIPTDSSRIVALVVLDTKEAEMHGDRSPTEHRWTSESVG